MLPQRPWKYTKYSLRSFRRLAAFLPRQNCCAPDSDGFSSDFWLLRRRCVVTPRNQIKAQQSGFDLKRKKERAKCSFRRKAETKWRKFLLTMRKGQKAPERRAVRLVCPCQPRVQYIIFRRHGQATRRCPARSSIVILLPLGDEEDRGKHHSHELRRDDGYPHAVQPP